MTGDIHPLAPHSLPPFVGAADGSDPLFSAIVFIVILAVLGVGVFYLKLHAIPEQLAHKQISADHGPGVIGAVHAQQYFLGGGVDTGAVEASRFSDTDQQYFGVTEKTDPRRNRPPSGG